MGLCVKKNTSQYMGVLGYPVARGILRDARAGEAGLRGGWNALESPVSWLNQGKPLQPNPNNSAPGRAKRLSLALHIR
jgi:hypothetical protein